MKKLSQKIKDSRMNMGLSQEELANRMELSLRTIQRFENGRHRSRPRNINKVTQLLGIDQSCDLAYAKIPKGEIVMNWLLLTALNFFFAMILGYLIMDVHANLNSRIGAMLFFVLMAFFIRQNTESISRWCRLLRYGAGPILYLIISINIVGGAFVFQSLLLLIVIAYIFILVAAPFRNNF